MPHGQFLSDLTKTLGQNLDDWKRCLVSSKIRAPFHRLRFGRADYHTEDVVPRPALALSAADWSLELRGTTDPFVFNGSTTTVVRCVVSRYNKIPPRDLVKVYLDCLMLAASRRDGIAGDYHGCFLMLSQDGKDPRPLWLKLKDLAPQEARNILAALAEDLIGNTHAYRLPISAVLDYDKDRNKPLTSYIQPAKPYECSPLWRLEDLPVPDDAKELIDKRLARLLFGIVR
jgi:hypothetical protein